MRVSAVPVPADRRAATVATSLPWNRAAEELGLLPRKIIESPIHGADGNLEFLALYTKH